MRRATLAALAAAILVAAPGIPPAEAGAGRYYKVTGVDGDDMLKLRAGPGTGYDILLGLPNGTVLRLHGCDQTGSTRWCEVSLRQARGLKGYVSWGYLREL